MTFDTTTWRDKKDYDTDIKFPIKNIDREGMYTLDVTPIVQEAVAYCSETCPFSIVLVAEDDASVGFKSSEVSERKRRLLSMSKK